MKTSRRSLKLILLVVLFAAPSLFAYLFYCHPNWLMSTPTNRGTLVRSTPILKSMDQSKHWRLVWWNPTACTNKCMAQMDQLARIRLALGRRLYHVDSYLLLSESEPLLSKEQKKILHDNDSNVLILPADAEMDRTVLGEQSAFYIVSPENAIILMYPSTSQPDDLFQDIKQLVKDK